MDPTRATSSSDSIGSGGSAMNQRSAFRWFPALILTAGLLFASSGKKTTDKQDKPGDGTETQSKPADKTQSKPADKKADASQTTSQAASSQEPTAQNTNWGPYEVFSSVEFGVRGIGINGNGNKFRSDQNYDPGFRIFDASLLMRSTGAEGFLFDELMINTFGWSNDPNRFVRA